MVLGGSLHWIFQGVLVKVFTKTDYPFRCYVLECGVRLAIPFKVFEAAIPITPVSPALGVAVTFLTHSPVIVKKVRFKFVGGVKTVFSVLKFNNPLGFYRLGELKRLTVLLLILSVRFRDKIEFQVFIRPFPVQVDVEV